MDIEPRKFLLASVELKLTMLGDVNTAVPLELSEHEIEAMKAVLVESGLNIEPGTEALASLQESQFRSDLEKGRGPGMVAVMGSPDKVLHFRSQCRKLAISRQWSYLIGGNPESEGRGLMQTGADLITICASQDPDLRKTLMERISRRSWKGLVRASGEDPEIISALDANFNDLERPEIDSDQYRKLTSMPPGGAISAWRTVVDNSASFHESQAKTPSGDGV